MTAHILEELRGATYLPGFTAEAWPTVSVATAGCTGGGGTGHTSHLGLLQSAQYAELLNMNATTNGAQHNHYHHHQHHPPTAPPHLLQHHSAFIPTPLQVILSYTALLILISLSRQGVVHFLRLSVQRTPKRILKSIETAAQWFMGN